MKLFLTSTLALVCIIGWGQANNPLKRFDILKYKFQITVVEESDTVYGQATILFNNLTKENSIALNFKNKDNTTKGMEVINIVEEESRMPLNYKHQNDLLTITTKDKSILSKPFTIYYKGIPTNGMVIGKNKFEDKTWFGDNWPNRAQYWLPCVDHIADKAIIEWVVFAPSNFTVVANGLLVKTTEEEKFKKWNFIESNPIPTKVTVIGIAKLEKKCSFYRDTIEVCNYYYPQTFAAQPNKMNVANEILAFFEKTIGPYPFQKLNNVQSTTMFGGMENADNIFYDERAVDDTATMEPLIAHEIAHQWFGNTVTEKDFSHLWLSEGFATFFTHYYLEKKYGVDFLNKRLAVDRAKVKGFLMSNKLPVVNTTTNYMNLLNANSYEKGGLFLQALRKKIGDTLFFTIIKTYYSTYKYKNANTDDFRVIVEKLTKKDFKPFFKQWLYDTKLPD
jgi:aminopeptidase N